MKEFTEFRFREMGVKDGDTRGFKALGYVNDFG